MTPKEFSVALMRSVVEENTEAYQDIFFSNTPDTASDPYWKRALLLFENLPPDQKNVLFEIIRQVCVDTVSNILGVIDGVNFIDDSGDGFTLINGKDNIISGDLQNYFLIEEEKKLR